ncbi:MAG TPA: hypothetical protein VFS05_00760 [Gemmatimonadaceae bacterium]|nr:hypothetical protein [Gemmatimonadaceae bacterium]
MTSIPSAAPAPLGAATALPPAPTPSVPQLWDRAFALARAHYAPLVTISALSLLLTAPVSIAGAVYGTDGMLPGMAGLLSVLYEWIIGAVAYGAMIVVVAEAYHGGAPSVADAARASVRRTVPLVLTLLAMMLVMVLGVLLLIVPGVLAFVRLFAVQAAVVLEGAGVREAFRRSIALSRGYGWRILGTAGVATVVYLAMTATLVLALQPLVKSQALATVLSSVALTLVTPVIVSLATVLYLDIRARREGYDIELAVRALASAPPSA